MKERYILEGREPFEVLKRFEDICSIPHGSGHEGKLGEFVISIAEEHGYPWERDDTGNILIRIPASTGCESAPSMCIQGHLDMVLAKKDWVELDMVNEPIELILEGNVLRANGTTLGADNAVGLCNMLAVMDHPELRHPPLELLFTVSEEVGLVGMRAFDLTKLRSRRMLNMDMGDPGLLEISSAGTSKIRFKKAFERLGIPDGSICLSTAIKGLRGGHSGLETGKNRGDAVEIISRILSEITENVPGARLSAIRSPEVSAGIPSFASVEYVIPSVSRGLADQLTDTFRQILSRELVDDPDMELVTEEISLPESVLSERDTVLVSDFLLTIPKGVFRRNEKHLNWVTSSSTLSIVRLDSEGLYAYMSYRVNDDAFREGIESRIRSVCRMTEVGYEIEKGAPAWPESRDSVLRRKAKEVYFGLFGEEMTEDSCHGSVEVSVAAAGIPDMEIIGTAPYSRGAHTPDEWLDLDSIGPFWEYLKALLSSLAEG